MNPDRWKQIERLYQASIDLPADQRDRFLRETCPDEETKHEVASLIAHRDAGLSFIERPAMDAAADIIARRHPAALISHTIGPYLITSLIGEGGMGVVYRARDSRLDRDVALKMLPDDLANDRDLLARFEQEAKLLACLNHPNIGGIYDLQESDGIRCLVLEFIEGHTLAERLERGRIPLDEGLTICSQIAEALEAAHERGIVHRDLKTSNVMITSTGSVKVLDFGIARMLAAGPGGSELEVDSTTGGVMLGTPSYMSPEQASGTPADKRTDIWAFGCVLYEVLAGRRAFEKGSVTDTLAAVIEQEPNWNALPRSTPPKVEDLLRRCLQKDPRWRLRDVGDARIDLVERSKSQSDSTVTARRARSTRWLWVSAVAGVALIALTLTQSRVRPVLSEPEIRLEVTTPPTADPVSLAISPDGRKLVFVATDDGRSRLWVRSLDSIASRALERTDHASCPFWSPDSVSVGFFADGQLKRVDIETGAVRELAIALSCGGTWNRDGTILYSSPLFGPISKISASGGTAGAGQTNVTRVARPAQRSHRFPQFLPDHRHFLFYIGGRAEVRGVYVGDLAGGEPRRLLDADTAAVYASGHVLFVRHGALVAQAFDPTSLTLMADPFRVAEHVAFDPANYAAAVSASSDGVIVYRAGSVTGRRQFVWFDRTGRELARIGDPDSAGSLDPSLSPDEQRVAFYRTVNAQPDIWLMDTRRAVLSRFTTEGRALRPIWSPDGSKMVYATGTPTNLFLRPVAGQADEQAILETSRPKAATDWSKDGRFVLYRSNDLQTGWDIWALPLESKTAVQVVRTRFDDRDGQFSPDAKWIAYQSNESGRFEIYVQSFPRAGDKATISRGGGAQVRWRADGRELFYVAFDNRLMAVPVAADSETIEVGAPTPLFTTRIGGAVQGPNRQQYMVSSDGQRFLMNTVVEDAISPIAVLLNWNFAHRERMEK